MTAANAAMNLAAKNLKTGQGPELGARYLHSGVADVEEAEGGRPPNSYSMVEDSRLRRRHRRVASHLRARAPDAFEPKGAGAMSQEQNCSSRGAESPYKRRRPPRESGCEISARAKKNRTDVAWQATLRGKQHDAATRRRPARALKKIPELEATYIQDQTRTRKPHSGTRSDSCLMVEGSRPRRRHRRVASFLARAPGPSRRYERPTSVARPRSIASSSASIAIASPGSAGKRRMY
jgi:hypothetical protein